MHLLRKHANHYHCLQEMSQKDTPEHAAKGLFTRYSWRSLATYARNIMRLQRIVPELLPWTPDKFA